MQGLRNLNIFASHLPYNLCKAEANHDVLVSRCQIIQKQTKANAITSSWALHKSLKSHENWAASRLISYLDHIYHMNYSEDRDLSQMIFILGLSTFLLDFMCNNKEVKYRNQHKHLRSSTMCLHPRGVERRYFIWYE